MTIEIIQFRELVMQAVPTDFVGTVEGKPVRIWQACTPDGSNFLLGVAALIPFDGVTPATAALLEAMLIRGGPDALADPSQAVAMMRGRPDGLARDAPLPPTVRIVRD